MAAVTHMPQSNWQVPTPPDGWNHSFAETGSTSPSVRAGIQSHVEAALLETLRQTNDSTQQTAAPPYQLSPDSWWGDLDGANCLSDDILDLYLPDDDTTNNGQWCQSPSHPKLAVASDSGVRTPRADMRLEPEPEVGAKLRKSVSIGRLSVVRLCDKDSPPGVKDTYTTDHSELTRDTDGPREVTRLVDKLIVTHFESWSLCDPGAVVNFVGPSKFAQLGDTIVDRLETIVDLLRAGAEHVGMLPSCVRIGPNHLDHLCTLVHWVQLAMQELVQEQEKIRSASVSSSSPESDVELHQHGGQRSRRYSDAFTGPGSEASPKDDEYRDNGWGWGPNSPKSHSVSSAEDCGWSPGVDADDEDNAMMQADYDDDNDDNDSDESDMQVEMCATQQGMIGLMLDGSSFQHVS